MKTKIIATIGPASMGKQVLGRMIDEGMSIARINTKYGSTDDYTKIAGRIREIGGCKVLFDIVGTRMVGWLKEQKLDYLAVSFAETAGQIRDIRGMFGKRKIKIISKIETKKGIENIDMLIRASDGIMVARGDLGKNTPLERIPIEQKLIIRKCSRAGKMDITATEMLLSMVNSRTPARSEVSDVANAVLDGSDAVMLSEETAVGRHPALAVRMMRKVVEETEKGMKLLRK